MKETDPSLDRLEPLFRALRGYHSHVVIGMEHVPREGAAILVHNHSLATYDNLLLGAAIYTTIGRLVHGLGDRLMFRVPGIAAFARKIGFVEASFTAALDILHAGALIGLTPGGMHEALKPSSERYQLRWSDRKGFARLAIAAQCPIVLAANPRGDHIYRVVPSRITDFVYRRFKLPLPIAFGRALTPLPRPIALTHVLQAPIDPPPLVSPDDAGYPRVVDEFHAELVARMTELMKNALALSARATREA